MVLGVVETCLGPGHQPAAAPRGPPMVAGGNFLELQAEQVHASMPAIMYGTAWKEEKTANLVAQALGVGYRGIDTANQPEHYREDLVGEGIRQFLQQGGNREELFVQTKFSPNQRDFADAGLVPYDPAAPLADQVRQSVDKSLANLGLAYLDCLVLHSPLSTMEETMEAWGAMQELVASGKVLQLGISNIY